MDVMWMGVLIVSAVVLAWQDYYDRQVSLLPYMIFIVELWPNQISCDVSVMVGTLVLAAAWLYQAAAWADIIVCLCLILENSLWSWGILLIATQGLVTCFDVKSSMPLVGAMALSWLILRTLSFSIEFSLI